MCALKYFDLLLISMARQCAVPNCRNSRRNGKIKGIVFHRFPRDPLRRTEWLIKCQIYESINPDLAVICSDHFLKSDYFRSSKSDKLEINSKKLKSVAVPSKKLPEDFYYIKNQDAIQLVIEADPVPLTEYDNNVLSFTDPDDVLLSDLKRETSLISTVRSPLTIKNDLISSIHYDHSYAIPFSDNFVHKTMFNVNSTFNGNRWFEKHRFTNDIGTMTETVGTEFEHVDEFQREIRWLWQKNRKMQSDISLLKARNRELVSKNLRTRKELLQKKQKFNELRKKFNDLEEKYCKGEHERE